MTISLVQIGALLLGLLSFVMYWISPDVLDQIKWLLWMTIMTVIIVGENIIMALYGIGQEGFEEDDDEDQG